MDNKSYDIYGITLKTPIELLGCSSKSKNYTRNYSLLINENLKKTHMNKDFPYANPYSLVNKDDIIISWRKNLTYKIKTKSSLIEVYKENYIPNVDFTLSLNYILSIICFLNDMLPIHGACLQDKHGKINIFIGNSSVGKSTLAANLLYKGWKYISEEMTALKITDNHIIPYGGGKFLRLSDESIKVIKSYQNNFVLQEKGNQKNIIWDPQWSVSQDQSSVCNIIYLYKSNDHEIKNIKYQESIPLIANNIYAPTTLSQFSKINLMKLISKVCMNLNCFTYSFKNYPSADFLDSFFSKQDQLD